MKHLFASIFLASLCAAAVPVVGARTSLPPPVVSRAEAVKAIVEGTPLLKQRLDAFRGDMPPLPLYFDVPQKNQLAPYLEAAFEQGIITANDDRLFQPTRPITNEEVATLHARTIALADVQAAEGIASSVAAGEQWYARPAAILQAHGILTENMGSNQPASRNTVGRMTGQTLALVAGTAPAPAAAVAQSSASAPTSLAAVPQYLPIRLQPLPKPQSSSSVQAATGGQQIAAFGGIPQFIQGQGTEISAGQNGGSVVYAANTTDSTAHIDVNAGSGGGGEINAGSSNAGIDNGPTTFTITIPSQNIGPLTVTNPTDPFTHNGLLEPLKNGVGHLFGNPGGGGKILVYGHSSSYPWDVSPYTKIFRQINKLNPGDDIIIDYNGQQYRYKVSYEETVAASDMSAYQDDGNGEDLILYTCWPPDSITQRYLVHAKPV